MPTDTQNELLTKWRKAAQDLIIAKDNEMSLRSEVFKEFFPKPDEGTQHIDIGFGYNLKLVHKVNYTLDKDKDKLAQALVDIAAIDNQGSFIADRLINYKPELSVKEYKSLDDKYKKVIDPLITTKDGAPAIEIEPPKEKK